jgi:hypothetical protein
MIAGVLGQAVLKFLLVFLRVGQRKYSPRHWQACTVLDDALGLA